MNTKYAQKLALEAANQAVVMLKNDDKNLPWNPKKFKNGKIILIGPNGNSGNVMQGSYHGKPPFVYRFVFFVMFGKICFFGIARIC